MKIRQISILLFLVITSKIFASTFNSLLTSPYNDQIKFKKLSNLIPPQEMQNFFSKQKLLSRLHMETAIQKNARGTIVANYKAKVLDKSPWYFLNPLEDKLEGISRNKAFENFYINSQKEVIVAVIDGGIDVNHQDLQGKIWINSDEVPNNGIDDDGNGYIDDFMGWNFLGAKDGNAKFIKNDFLKNKYTLIEGPSDKQVIATTYAETRLVRSLNDKVAKGEDLTLSELNNLNKYTKLIQDLQKESNQKLIKFKKLREEFLSHKSTLFKAGHNFIDLKSLQNLKIDQNQKELILAKLYLTEIMEKGFSLDRLDSNIQDFKFKSQYWYNLNCNARYNITKDDPFDMTSKYYGNNDVKGPMPDHGTHLAGIIAATKNKQNLIEGIAPNVKIMPIRAIPEGDEFDKDVANAIFYAVDNGAQIINMSFGNNIASPNKWYVNEAIRYAQEHNVLIVHSAGNSNNNNDTVTYYPNRFLENNLMANNWIEVAASGKHLSSSLASKFTNFGEMTVDIFSPGVKIHSTIANNKYATFSGTSMATPIVSGVAAILLSYDNSLTPHKIKNILMKSARSRKDVLVYKPNIGKIHFSKLSISGSVIDLYNALVYLNSN